jgi:AcrR family transcriptional regulator
MDTREKIILTALDLFLQDGYERTSMNRIAQAVGITKPAIYHHFSGKEELFRDVLAFFFEEMKQWSMARFKSCKSLHELLHSLFRSLGSFGEVPSDLLLEQTAKPTYSMLELILAASKKDPEIQKKIEDVSAQSRAAIGNELINAQREGEIREDIDCEALALQIHATIEGVSLIASVDRSIDIDAVGEKMFGNLWRMLE